MKSSLARYKETTAQESLDMPNSHVVTKASIPIAPSWPKTWLVVGLALTLGVGVRFVLAFLVDYLDQRVKTLEQAGTAIRRASACRGSADRRGELAKLAKRGRQELSRYDPKTVKLLPQRCSRP